MEIRFNNHISSNNVNRKSSVSFSGAPISVANLKKALEKTKADKAKKEVTEAAKKINFFTKFDDFYCKNKERNIIFVTAFGTGIVAPIILAINPISKEDSNTKKYTALRQPISAGLAVLSQVGINQPIPGFLEKISAKGKLGYDYLPDPEKIKNKKINVDDVFELYSKALQDDKFKSRIIEFTYQSDLNEAKDSVLKEVSYKDQFFNKTIRENIKKEIQANTAKVKRLTLDEIDIKKAIKYTAKNFDTFRNLTQICASVAVLWPTFSILNWIYPRFVEKCFPQLIKDKAPDLSAHKTGKAGGR